MMRLMRLRLACPAGLASRPAQTSIMSRYSRFVSPLTGSFTCQRPVCSLSRRLVPCSQAQVANSNAGRTAPFTTTTSEAPSDHPATPHKEHAMDYTTLVAVVSEIRSSGWVPSKVEQALQSDPQTVSLRLRTPRGAAHLYLSWHPTHSRVCLGDAPTRGAVSEAFNFGEQLQNKLSGQIVTGIDIPAPWERVVRVQLAPRLSDPPGLALYAEVMGRNSNLVLVGERGEILACAQQIGEKQSRLRQLRVGDPYSLPPTARGIPPSLEEGFHVWADNVRRGCEAAVAEATKGGKTSKSPTLSDVLPRLYAGASPSLIKELLEAAGLSDIQASRASHNPPEFLKPLFKEWRRWLHCVIEGKGFAAGRTGEGAPSVLGGTGAGREEGEGAAADLEGESQRGAEGPAGTSGRRDPGLSPLLSLVAASYSGFEGAKSENMVSLKKDCERAVTAAIRKVENRLKAFDAQLDGASESGAVQHQGDLLVASMYLIKPGMESLEVEDWETGEPVKLVLDPQKTPQEQAEAYFKKAKKLRRAVEQVSVLKEESEGQLEYLRGVEVSLQQLGGAEGSEDVVALNEILEELVSGGFMKPRADAALGAKAAQKARRSGKGAAGAAGGEGGLRSFKSPSGYRVLVGRNNRQNDELSTKVAKDADLWFHAQGCPGAHVVLRVRDKSEEPAEEDVRFAASLAAYYSKARNSGRYAVSMIKAGNVRKPKGAPPGMVMLTGPFKTVTGFPPEVAALNSDGA